MKGSRRPQNGQAASLGIRVSNIKTVCGSDRGDPSFLERNLPQKPHQLGPSRESIGKDTNDPIFLEQNCLSGE